MSKQHFMFKRLILLILLMAYLLSFATIIVNAAKIVPSEVAYKMSNFKLRKQTFRDNIFNDVSSRPQWARDGIKKAFELGIMQGKGDKTFDPTGNMTIAESIKILAVIHATYAYGTGGESEIARYVDQSAKHWVEQQGYLQYCKTMGILDNSFDAKLSNNMTRGEMAFIWSKALYRTTGNGVGETGQPKNDYQDFKNTQFGGRIITDPDNIVLWLPDVDSSTKYWKNIYAFYETGVTVGVDEKGTFNPNDNISREQAAVIFLRLTDKSSRLKGRTFVNESDYKIGDVTFNDSKNIEIHGGKKIVDTKKQIDFVEALFKASEGVKISADKRTVECSFDLSVPVPAGFKWAVTVASAIETGGGAELDSQRAGSPIDPEVWMEGNIFKGKIVYDGGRAVMLNAPVTGLSISAGLLQDTEKTEIGSKADIVLMYNYNTGQMTWSYSGSAGSFFSDLTDEKALALFMEITDGITPKTVVCSK